MTDPTKVLADSNPVDDVANADPGDKRRNERYVQIVDAVSHRPDSSVPEALEDGAEHEGDCRFVRNPNVDDEALIDPHFEATAKRAQKVDEKYCVFTIRRSFRFPSIDERHASLVCSADSTRAPLGLIETQAFVHETDLRSGQKSLPSTFAG